MGKKENEVVLEVVPVEKPEDIERGLRIKEAEHNDSVEAGANWVLGMLEKGKIYGERIPLKENRSFDILENVTEQPGDVAQLVRSAKQMKYSQKGLYDLAKEISQRHSELRFSFKIDPKGKWIEYSVQKQYLKVGDEVMWESQGVIQCKGKILSIHKDPGSKREFAFVEGVTTGIPLGELILSQE